MSRIEYCEPSSVAEELRSYAFDANTNRHMNGRKGQKALLELEAALLAMQDKRLASSTFAVTPESNSAPAVCAIGAMAVRRKEVSGLSTQEAVAVVVEEAPRAQYDYASWWHLNDVARYMGLNIGFVWSVVERNDEIYGNCTPDERYDRVLGWCQSMILPLSRGQA